ncbi:hypothetical protein ET524_09675 [Senegalimassilia faecalis]|uniref:Uncharacterized protein n=1 Tax=Senegalimassilia faecalis TaxID=2509433 RepID=A0A4Q2K018_9ACTN|nr:hypothetical protein [Senegalimassilia faecalis]RXZ54719.1 hypothetical protein ET524_09675 [Senegalimassilia faecalis]
MNVPSAALTLPQLRVPSAKTVAVCLLQALGLAVALYVVAIVCAAIADATAANGGSVPDYLNWLWIVPIPFYALAIGGKIAADALGNPSLLNSLWLRLPGRIAFSIPTLKMVAWTVFALAISLKSAQDDGTAINMLLTIVMVVGATTAAYWYYIKKLGCFKDKPVADALFVSFFPVWPAVMAGVGMVMLAIIVTPFLLAIVGGTMKQSK